MNRARDKCEFAMKKLLICLAVLTLFQVKSAPADKDLGDRAQGVLKKATTYFMSISTNGGYAGIYSLDLKKRYGEAIYEPAKLSEIWVQPPGTPSVGECFLRAFRITQDSLYLEAARNAGRALAWGQSRWGGWGHRAEVAELKPDSREPDRKETRCTFDEKSARDKRRFNYFILMRVCAYRLMVFPDWVYKPLEGILENPVDRLYGAFHSRGRD